MKMKEFGPGGASLVPPLDPPIVGVLVWMICEMFQTGYYPPAACLF